MKPKKTKPQSFADILRSKRGRLSQSEAAEVLGVPVDTLQNWEQERNIPDAFKQKAIIAELAKARRVTG